MHKLGMHWLRHHPDNQRDFAHIERMQYRSIKPFEWMWNNRDFCNNLLAVLPKDAYILARDHPMSEQKDDMWRDPVGTGVRHANEWAEKVRSGQYHLPIERTYFLGINEPDATNGDRAAIDRYNTAYLRRLQAHGLRGGAFNFSTGHPRTVDGTANTPADYSVFESTHAAIVEGGHIAVAHIYGTTAVPLAKGHYDRLAACTWTDVQWVIGEFGIDEHVVGGGPHIGFHAGYNGRLHEYCGWIDRVIMAIEAIFPYIHSYLLYTDDFSHPWETFDVRPIRSALETYDWQHGKQQSSKPDTSPVTIHLPSINNGKPMPRFEIGDIVRTTTAVNARSQPGIYGSEVLVILDANAPLELLEGPQYADGLVWWRTEHGWVAEVAPNGLALLSNKVDALKDIEPVVVTSGAINPLVAEAVLQVESGNNAYSEGKLVIRLELHLFRKYLNNNALFDAHFYHNPQQGHLDQKWRRSPSAPWQPAHLGSSDFAANQRHEWELFGFAAKLNRNAALMSTSMGAAQIMGFHYKRIGYPSPEAMFNAFQRSEAAQIIGFFNYCISDSALLEALRKGNWTEIARRYNGDSHQVPLYVQLMKDAYQTLLGG